MLSIFLFVLVISAFAVYACFNLNKTFEETIPVSCMGIILLLFLCGMVNILKIGAVLVCVAAIFIYGYTFFTIIRKGFLTEIKNNIFNLVTPGFVVFIIFAVMLAYWNQGRLATRTDEFSHWLDTVVIMSQIDAFGTAAGSTAIFPSYPPAMSLFQYLLEKINMLVTGDFSEWKTYYAYQLLAVVALLPFTKVKGQGLVKKVSNIITWPILVIVPIYFFSEAYCSLYIDPFLGVLGGCGFAAISLTRNKDWLYAAYVSMLCATLTLAKDVGIYLAIFISLYFAIDSISSMRIEIKNKNHRTSAGYLVLTFLPILSMAAVKLLWKVELAVSQTAQKFSAPFKISETIDALKGQGTDFSQEVLNNFTNAITYRYVYFERMGLNYTAIMVLLSILLICLHYRLYKRGELKGASCVAGTIIPSLAIVIYILSMFPLYISRFSEDEALSLASFDRYCGIMFLTGLLLVALLARRVITGISNRYLVLAASLALTFFVYHSKAEPITYYTSRSLVYDSQNYRQAIDILAQKINDNTASDARVLLVGYDEDQVFHPILDTICKPRQFTFSDVYFPAIEDDSGTGLTAEDLRDILMSNFDYVAVYRATDNLKRSYLELFSGIDDITNLTLYQVDLSSGTLVVVQ